MRRNLGWTIVAVAMLAGCSSPQLAEVEPGELDAGSAPVDEVRQSPCLDVTDATIAGLQWGVDERQQGLTVTGARAIVNPAPETVSWFVAGSIEGPGMGNDSIGVWYTLQDPTTAEGDSIAFVSVDAIASEFSSYVQPANFSSALEGVDEVRDCLD